MIDVNLINGIALAFEGDAVYSMYIRRHLIFQGMTKPNKLHQAATRYVSARAQASLIESMLEQEILTEAPMEQRQILLPLIQPERPTYRPMQPSTLATAAALF